MSEPQPSRFAQLQRRYQERNLPWDLALPPPEILTLAEALPPGRALGLGCGVGRIRHVDRRRIIHARLPLAVHKSQQQTTHRARASRASIRYNHEGPRSPRPPAAPALA